MQPLRVTALEETTEMTMEIQDDGDLYGVLDKLERLGLSIVSFAPAEADNGSHE